MCMWIGVGVRWQCIGGEDVWIEGRIDQRWKENSPWVFLKLGDRTTVKDQRWGELGVTRVGRNRCLLRSGGSAFASFRCCVWIGVCFVVVDRCLECSLISIWFAGLIGVWIVLSLSLTLRLFAKCVSLFCACYGKCLKVKQLCKMISGSTSVNFGQTEMIFRKIYFP